jgi:hypothetical protein
MSGRSLGSNESFARINRDSRAKTGGGDKEMPGASGDPRPTLAIYRDW